MRIAFALVLLAAAIPGVGMGDALRETGVGAGARSLAIGEGGAAALSGVESLYWNPAGIVGSPGMEFLLGHTAWVEDLNTEAGAAVIPVAGFGTFGACASWQTFSGIEERDASGNLVKTSDFTTGSGSLAWGCRLNGNISAGISAGFMVQSGLGVDESDIPLGAGVRAEFGDVALGVGGQGLISPQPAINAAASYRMTPGGMGLVLSGGAVIREFETRIGAGAEFEAGKVVRLRVGYLVPIEETGPGGFSNLTAGLGGSYRNIGLDYAFLPLGDIGQVHRIQLTFRLGGGSPAEPAR